MTVKLFHGTASVCSAKVRLAFEEKGIAYERHELNIVRGDQFDPEYLRLNPNAYVPTIVHDGHVCVESSVIIHYIDEAFAGPPLMLSKVNSILSAA